MKVADSSRISARSVSIFLLGANDESISIGRARPARDRFAEPVRGARNRGFAMTARRGSLKRGHLPLRGGAGDIDLFGELQPGDLGSAKAGPEERPASDGTAATAGSPACLSIGQRPTVTGQPQIGQVAVRGAAEGSLASSACN